MPPQNQSGFDVDGARKAGATDDQILQYLASKRNYDYQGALKAGASKEEIIQHLSSKPAPSPTPPSSSTSTISAAPKSAHPISDYFQSAINDVKYGSSNTFAGKLADFFQGRKVPGTRPGLANTPGGELIGGPLEGPLHVVHALSKTSEVPSDQELAARDKETLGQSFNRQIRPPLEMVAGAAQTASPAALLVPGGPIAVGTLPAVAQTGTSKIASGLGVSPEGSEALGDIAAFLAGGAQQKLTNQPVNLADQEKAFNVLYKKNASSNKPSILPEIRNAVAGEAPNSGKLNIPKGKPGVRTIENAAQKAIDAHEAATQPIKQQFAQERLDNSSAGAAARSQITPEMRVAAANGDKGVVAQIDAIESVAQRAEGAGTIETADQLRHTWNDELHGNYSKSLAAQDVAPAVTQAKQSALNSLRGNFYKKLGELSGQDLSPLAQREGLLLEAKQALQDSGNAALQSKGNDLSRGQAVKKAIQSIDISRPATLATKLPDVLRAVMNPDSITPTGKYVARVKRSLADLPPPQEVQPGAFPGGKLPAQQTLPLDMGPLFDIAQTPHTLPGSAPAIPTGASDLLQPGQGPAQGGISPYKVNQPVAAAVDPLTRSKMEGAEFGGFRVGSDETPNFGQTRRPLVTEEHPEIDATPQFIKAFMNPPPAPKGLPPQGSISLGPSSVFGEGAPKMTAEGVRSLIQPGTASTSEGLNSFQPKPFESTLTPEMEQANAKRAAAKMENATSTQMPPALPPGPPPPLPGTLPEDQINQILQGAKAAGLIR